MGEATILITGATDGLGRATAGRLGEMGHHLLLHGRDEAKLASVADDLEHRTGLRPRTFAADFSELAQVRRLAAEVQEATGRLDVLVNNAGIGFSQTGDTRHLSADGYELHFAVNYLASFLLTTLLTGQLRSASPSRIVNIASRTQAPFDLDDVEFEHDYSGVTAYGRSKLAMIAWTFELASRLESSSVTANCLHPGTHMPTKIVLHGVGRSVDSLESGIEAVTNLVVSPTLGETTGRYFEHTRQERANEFAYDPQLRARLWNLSVALTGAGDL